MKHVSHRSSPALLPVIVATAIAVAACGPPPTPPTEPEPARPPAPPPAAKPAPEPPPVADDEPPTVAESRCAQDLARELPVADGELGDGPRLVRVINNGEGELRARLVDAEGNGVLDGTLRIPAGEKATFKVGPGSYRVRYRMEDSCSVFEGSVVHLTGLRSGVEIGLKPLFEEGSSHDVRRVEGDL